MAIDWDKIEPYPISKEYFESYSKNFTYTAFETWPISIPDIDPSLPVHVSNNFQTYIEQ